MKILNHPNIGRSPAFLQTSFYYAVYSVGFILNVLHSYAFVP